MPTGVRGQRAGAPDADESPAGLDSLTDRWTCVHSREHGRSIELGLRRDARGIQRRESTTPGVASVLLHPWYRGKRISTFLAMCPGPRTAEEEAVDAMRRLIARAGSMISRVFEVLFVRGSGRRRP